MSGLFEVGTYLPDRPPTWLEVFMLVVLSPLAAFLFQSYSSLSLPAVGLGFVGVMVLVGPVSQTRHGKRVNEYEPGYVERAAVSVMLMLVGVGLISVFSAELYFAVLFGAILFCALALAVHVLRDRQIEDLVPPEW